MSEQPVTTLRPTEVGDRNVALDAVRGFAVLGILIVNVQMFAMIDAAYFNPLSFGRLDGVHGVVAAATFILANAKFMSIFSMLFGAGVVIFTSRLDAQRARPGRVYARRSIGLAVIGLVHAYFLWHGDVLFWYAICGLIVYHARHHSAKWLLAAGLIVLSIGSVISLVSGFTMSSWPPSAVAELYADFHPSPEAVVDEIAAYRGGFVDQMAYRVPRAFSYQTTIFLTWALWRVTGLMLIGMALGRVGYVTAEKPVVIYQRDVFLATVIGVPAVAYQWWHNVRVGFDPRLAFFIFGQINYWASVLIAVGYIGAVMWMCKTGAARAAGLLAPVGRMALTNYVGQSAFCTWLFYGHGLGLYGKVERGGQIAVVLGVWVFQIAASALWLRYFRFGPLEWLWRSWTYGGVQPLRRS